MKVSLTLCVKANRPAGPGKNTRSDYEEDERLPHYINQKISEGKMGKTKPTKPIHYRNAKTGQYVTPTYAKHHPATTVGETNSRPKGKK